MIIHQLQLCLYVLSQEHAAGDAVADKRTPAEVAAAGAKAADGRAADGVKKEEVDDGAADELLTQIEHDVMEARLVDGMIWVVKVRQCVWLSCTAVCIYTCRLLNEVLSDKIAWCPQASLQ